MTRGNLVAFALLIGAAAVGGMAVAAERGAGVPLVGADRIMADEANPTRATEAEDIVHGGVTTRAVEKHLTSQGYTAIRDIERDDGHYEAGARAPGGKRVEVYLDADTGDILRTEAEQ